MKHAMKTLTAAVSLALVAVPCLGRERAGEGLASPASERQAQRPPNILLIVADDLAADLGRYGIDPLTPNLDALARGGVSFERAYAQYPWCAPSRASFLTGTRPGTNGVFDLTTPFRRALPDIETLPQYFRNRGYYTARAGKIFHQGVPGGIGSSGADDPQSWDSVVNPRGRDKDAEDGRLLSLTPGIPLGSALTYLADDGDDRDQTDGKVATAAIEMLRANRGRPFFIAAGFYRPHVPEIVPKAYFDLYPLEKIRIAQESGASREQVLPAARAWTPDNFGMSADEQRRMIRAYLAATSFVDAQVGRILDELDDLGLADDTIVIFTSDHGYMLGEHGQWLKNTLWEEANRVPLIIRAPMTRARASRSERIVELLDLFPTLVDLAGLPANARNEGASLRPLLDRPADRRWTKHALSQVRGGRSVRTERWRYTEWEEGRLGAELYDHRRDPREQRNLATRPGYAATVAKLRQMLPPGTVEARPAAVAYDHLRDCLRSAPPATGTPPAGGDGGKGGRFCAMPDP